MQKLLKNNNRIGIDAIVFTAYLVTSPLHQILVLGNGSTITKYLAFASMIACIWYGGVHLNHELLNKFKPIILWFGLSVIWSSARSVTISSFISIVSYFALMIIVGSKDWNEKEKSLFRISMIIASIYCTNILLKSVRTMRRATIINEVGVEADQNILAANIGLGIIFAVYYFFKTKNKYLRIVMIICGVMILGGIISTGSRGALIAVVSAMLYFLMSSRIINKKNIKKILFITIVFIATLYIFLFTGILGNNSVIGRYTGATETTSGRSIIWTRYLQLLIHRPHGIILGYGYNAQGRAYGRYFGTRWYPSTHNDYIFLITSVGFIGLYFIFCLIQLVWNKSQYNRDILGRAVVVLMLVASLSVNIFMRYGWWNAMLFAYIGIGKGNNNEIDGETT